MICRVEHEKAYNLVPCKFFCSSGSVVVHFTAKYQDDGVTDILTSMTNATKNAATLSLIPGVDIDPNSIQTSGKPCTLSISYNNVSFYSL